MPHSALPPHNKGRSSREDRASTGPSRRAVLGWGLFALMAAGCANGAPSPGKSTRTELTFLAAAPPRLWDPAFIHDPFDQRIIQQICPPLVSINSADGNLTGILARTASLNEDGTRLRITLAHGLTFSDGTELDSDALKANFERWQKIASTASTPSAIDTLLADSASAPLIKSYKTLSKHVLDVHFARPCFAFPDALTHPGLGVLSPAAFGKDSTEPVATPIGAGAYTLEAKATKTAPHREETNTTRLKLRAEFRSERESAAASASATHSESASQGSPDYGQDSSHDGGLPLRPAPAEGKAPATIAFIHSSLSATPAQWLASKHDNPMHADVVDAVAAKEQKEIAQAGLRVMHRDPFSVVYLGFNHNDENLKQRAMRQAIVQNIDERQLLKDQFPESTLSANGYTPASLGVQPERPAIRDEKATTDLLKTAKYGGESIPIAYPTGVRLPYFPLPELTAQGIQKQLAEVHITTQLKPMHWDTEFLPALLEGKHTGLFLFGLHGLYRSPHDMLARLFSGPRPLCNARLTDIPHRLDAALAIASASQRRETYRNIETDLIADLPLYPLLLPASALGLSSDVTNYPLNPYLEEPLELVTMK